MAFLVGCLWPLLLVPMLWVHVRDKRKKQARANADPPKSAVRAENPAVDSGETSAIGFTLGTTYVAERGTLGIQSQPPQMAAEDETHSANEEEPDNGIAAEDETHSANEEEPDKAQCSGRRHQGQSSVH